MSKRKTPEETPLRVGECIGCGKSINEFDPGIIEGYSDSFCYPGSKTGGMIHVHIEAKDLHCGEGDYMTYCWDCLGELLKTQKN
jgi:hypothetical protein